MAATIISYIPDLDFYKRHSSFKLTPDRVELINSIYQEIYNNRNFCRTCAVALAERIEYLLAWAERHYVPPTPPVVIEEVKKVKKAPIKTVAHKKPAKKK